MAKIIRITSKIAGFRRAGIAHPREATDYEVDAFTEDELQLLRDEPNLTVEDAEVAAEGEEAKKVVTKATVTKAAKKPAKKGGR